MQLWRLITLRKECDIFALWLFTLEKHPDTWHNLSQKKTFIGSFPQFWHACDASCRVSPWCKKHYLSMHFESGQLNSRGDVLRRSSQRWHSTDIHQLHNANADWLAAPPTPTPPTTLLPQREKVPQFHCHFLTETHGTKKECLDGYVELNILGAGIHRSPPRCFLKRCKHNSDRFFLTCEKAAYAPSAATIAVGRRKPRIQKL